MFEPNVTELEVLEAALRLKPAGRLRVAEELFSSVEEADGAEKFSLSDAELAECERRLAELKSGTVVGLTAAQVFTRLEQAGSK